MADCGVSHLYRTRVDARDAFKNAIRDPRTRQVCIAGISLRDFFYDNGILKDVWSAIIDRMLQEDASKVPLDRRLHVRLLLLDPLSSEGYHRYQIERPFLEHGLRDDVPVAVQTVLAFCEKLTTSAHELLQVRLYSHGSFGFQFITDSAAIVEQYMYRDQRVDPAMPAIQYLHSAPAYAQLARSFDIVWRHCVPLTPTRTELGWARPLRKAGSGTSSEPRNS
jgi:hypothetical protein